MTNLLIINNLDFAKKQLKLTDQITVYTLKRLHETLGINEESAIKALINFDLSGRSNQFRYPSLHISIKSVLPAICQRCLSEMLVPLDLRFDYLISAAKLEEDADNDQIDWIEEQKEMNLLELIEDELLLALPIAPAHANECIKSKLQSGEKPNPFAVLKGKYK